MTGVNVLVFWGASFLWDFCTFIITILLIIVSVAPFQIPHWLSPGELSLVFIALFVFGFAALPMTYVLSSLFKAPSTGLQVMIFLNFLTGNFLHSPIFHHSIYLFHLNLLIYHLFIHQIFAGPLATVMFSVFKNVLKMSDAWEWVFLAFPHYAITTSFSNVDLINSAYDNCRVKCNEIPGCNLDKCCM